MSANFLDPMKLNQMAKIQGTMAGARAAHSSYVGIASAPITIFNQMGYNVKIDPNTGGSILEDNGYGDSVFSGKWYDQISNTNFNIF